MFSFCNSSPTDLLHAVLDLAAPPEPSIDSFFYPLYFTDSTRFHLQVLHHLQVNEPPRNIRVRSRVRQVNSHILEPTGDLRDYLPKEIRILDKPSILGRMHLIRYESRLFDEGKEPCEVRIVVGPENNKESISLHGRKNPFPAVNDSDQFKGRTVLSGIEPDFSQYVVNAIFPHCIQVNMVEGSSHVPCLSQVGYLAAHGVHPSVLQVVLQS